MCLDRQSAACVNADGITFNIGDNQSMNALTSKPTAKQTAQQIVITAINDAVDELNKHVPPSKEAQLIWFSYEIRFNPKTQRFEITHEMY